jgi:protoheme IX farnesyltransferase
LCKFGAGRFRLVGAFGDNGMNDAAILELRASAVPGSRLVALLELTRPRIALLVLITTFIGYYLALPSGFEVYSAIRLLATLIGTALVAAGSSALNQFLEADRDAQMTRTRSRPLPTKRLTPIEAVSFGVVSTLVGGFLLWTQVNPLASLLALLTFVVYVFLYTPLKVTGPLGVLTGAVAGALPPVIGWAGAAGQLSTGAWLLFLVIFFWQMPHFAGIAWLYREDYARAGYPFLPVVDKDGTRTNLHVMTHAVALLLASALPVPAGMVGMTYAIGAMVFGLLFLGCCILFVVRKQENVARQMVIASVVYLPAVFALMLIDKL